VRPKGQHVTSSQQQDRVKAMLIRYRDALAASSSIPTGEQGDRLLMFPPSFNQALRELDRCLGVMRSQGNQQAINGVPLKTICWHTIAWYVDVTHKQVPVYARQLTRHHGKGPKMAWAKRITGYKLEPRRHRDAREEKAELGVKWLASEYRWDRVHLKAINEACGELMAA